MSRRKQTRLIALVLLTTILFACSFKSLEEQLRDEAGSISGNAASVKEFLAKGAKVDDTDERGESALMKAAWMGKLEIVKILIDAGANAKQTDKYSYTPLMKAIQGAQAFSKDGKPMFAGSDYENTMKVLIASGVKINATNHVGATALQIALDESPFHGDAETVGRLVKILLEGGADPNVGERSVLFTAAMNGQTEAIQALVNSGKLDIHSRNVSGETALMLAVEKGHVDTARVLVTSGADVNEQDKSGRTVLIVASEKGNSELVQNILELGANPIQKDNEGKTALHYAVAKGDAEMVKALLNRGADSNTSDKSGMTPLKSAEWAGRAEIVALLKANGQKNEAVPVSK